jgi:hypothetical protein
VRLRDGRVLVQYRGLPFDWRKRTATFGLNPSIPWSFEIVGGIQRVEADLRSMDVRRLDITGGIERAQIELDRPVGTVPIRIVGGAKTIRIERPRDVAVRVKAVGGTGGLTLDGMVTGKHGAPTMLETASWAADRDGYDVEIVGGSKSIDVVGRP